MLKKISFLLLILSIYSCKTKIKEIVRENYRLENENAALHDSIKKLTDLNLKDTISPIIEMGNSSKIIYMGLKNNVKIAVPNSDSIVIRDNGKIIKPTKQGSFLIDPSPRKDRTKNIEIISFFKNNTIDTINYDFNVRSISKIKASINGSRGCCFKMFKNELKNATFSTYNDNYIYDSYSRIRGFKIVIKSSDPEKCIEYDEAIEIEGNKITNDAYKIINNLNEGDEIFFFKFNLWLDSDIQQNVMCIKPPPVLIVEIMNNR